ncbi:ABC transporter substrate-binding protein [Nocardioides sp.]|uniref:ABC transporter substrate-binding protein n=1 Tax=Nocardioides sp. TaxID=35761 RepID=UPI0026331890|nr:ABC transporter substrate-binding protein [Nocardioides sp.]
MSLHRPLVRTLAALTSVAAVAVSLTACGSDASSSAAAATKATDGTTQVTIAAKAGDSYPSTTLAVPEVAQIRATLPAAVTQAGTLTIGIGALPTGFPPLAYVGTDDSTLTGAEPDLGRLVAAVLGLKPEVVNATWDNLFVGIDSGRTDVGFSNITDTEKRKEKYDFASYRQDNLSFIVAAKSALTFSGDPAPLAGLTIAVSAGTNQEKILIEFSNKLKAEGKKPITIKYFADTTSTWAALESGQIDAYFGPNPTNAYQVAQTKDRFRIAGTYSGAGSTLQGLIAATVKKGSGLAEPVAKAIDYLIKNGQYATWLKTYGISNEAVTSSQINPPGLPLDNS